MSHASPRDEFVRLLGGVREAVDVALASWLRPRVVRASGVSAEVGAAAAAIERLALRGGKRMRAALVASAYEACGGDGGHGRVMPAMVAVELLQVYLLIHDDWMDHDAVRRGGPAVHVELRERLGESGDAAAILAGDLACAYAQEALLETPLGEGRVLAAARAFARIQQDVVTGQLAEMRGPSGAAEVEEVHALKTASYTVTGPLALGAHLAGADAEQVEALARFGRPLGVAFQLRDDVLGVFGDPAATGKPVGNDVRQGKRTAVVAELARDPAGEALLARALGRADAGDAEIDAVVRAMETTGARARVEARIEELLDEARRALDAIALSPTGKAQLAGAVGALGERDA